MQQPLLAGTLLTVLIASSCGGQSETDAQRNPLVNDPAQPVTSAEDGTAVGDNKSGNHGLLPDRTDTGESATEGILCDGSDEVRFVYAQDGGIDDGPEFRFTGVYGSAFLVFDGQCNFWLGEAGMAGIRTGHLNHAEGVALSKAIQYGRYKSVADFQGQSCDDAGGTFLFDGTSRLVSFCVGSSPGAPAVWERAFTAVLQARESLRERSKPSWGPTSILVVESQARRADPVPWRVNIKLKPLAITFDELSGRRPEPLGTLIEDPETLQQLGQFRDLALKAYETQSEIPVEDDGAIYEVYVRDELPAKVATAIADVQRD